MNAKELADKFNAKTEAAVVERQRQSGLAAEHVQKRSEDIEHCKRAMESNVLPFLAPATAERKGALRMSTRLMPNPISQIRVISRGTRSPNWSKW